MFIRKYADIGKTHKNLNLIHQQINDIENLKSTNVAADSNQYTILRTKHSHQNAVYFYYENNYEDFQQYKYVCDTEFVFENLRLKGKIITYLPLDIFKKFPKTNKINMLMNNEYFYNSLINNPVPFVFLPDEDLETVSLFLKSLIKNQNINNALFVNKVGGSVVMLMEPINLIELGLDYMIDSFYENKGLKYFLPGFFYLEEQ